MATTFDTGHEHDEQLDRFAQLWWGEAADTDVRPVAAPVPMAASGALVIRAERV